MRRRLVILAVGAVLALSACERSGCGGDSGGGDDAPPPAEVPSALS